MRSQSNQQGVALIIALVITTIAVSLASLAMYRQQLQIRLSTNISNLEQAYEYAAGMEDWSKKILEQDYKDDPKVDSLQEDWASDLPPIAIPGGSLKGRLFDLQGRINLNSLNNTFKKIKPKSNPNGSPGSSPNDGPPGSSPNDGPPGSSPNGPQGTPQKPTFKTETLVYNIVANLITTIDKEQTLGPPENFSDTLKDWIDKDDEESQGGAESSYYQSQEHPYMSANSLLMDKSELILLKGMTKEITEKLLPLVSTLPKDSKINVNTAEKEVLEAIGFDQETIADIKSARDETPFKTMQDFWNLDKVKTFFAPTTEAGKKKANYQQILSNTSDYFLLQGQVNINNARLFINSVLERKNGKVRVIMRDYSKPAITTSSTKSS